MILFHSAAGRSFTSPGIQRHLSLTGSLAWALLFLLSIFSSQLYAQDTNDSDIEVVRVRTDLVTVPVFVFDARGRRIGGLKESDFVVRDDGRAVKIEYFAAGTERVALLFALDASGSAREIIARQREAALALFKRFGQTSKVAVLHFGETAQLYVPFTGEAKEAMAAFDFSAIGNRRTAIFDAALAAVRAFDARRMEPTERRIVILISDGLDNASAAKPRAVIDEAQARFVSLYTIQLPLFEPRNGRLAPRRAVKGFREMAEQTGGRFFVAGDPRAALGPNRADNLAPVFQAIEDDLKGQYVFGYYPGEAVEAGRFHHIEINLTGRGTQKLRVRQLREGYRMSDR